MKFPETKPNTHLPPNALRPKHGYEDRPNKKQIPSARQDKAPNGASS